MVIPFTTKPLRAVFLTDMGSFRGKMMKYYRNTRDKKSLLMNENLNFPKTTIDSVYQILVHCAISPKPLGLSSYKWTQILLKGCLT